MFIAESKPLPNVPRPVGADPNGACLDDWQVYEGRRYRLVWSRPLPLDGPWSEPPQHLGNAPTEVRVVATQFADGSLATTGADAPMVYIGMDDYSPDHARRIATAILAAADLADGWVQR